MTADTSLLSLATDGTGDSGGGILQTVLLIATCLDFVVVVFHSTFWPPLSVPKEGCGDEKAAYDLNTEFFFLNALIVVGRCCVGLSGDEESKRMI